jgi:hypothetical protein
MYQRFHDRFGTAGVVIAVIALVAALGGTAVAAGGLTKAQEKQVTKIAKKYAGKPGAAGKDGAAGPAGPAGPGGGKGDAGGKGATGAKGPTGGAGVAGTNGKTVLSGAANPTNAIGTQGDFYINTTTDEIFGPKPSTAGAWGSGTPLKGEAGEDGEDGSPWVVGTAPSEVVMKGTWAVQQYTAAGAGEIIPIPLSTGVPIEPITAVSIDALMVKPGENLPGQSTEEREEAEGICPGSANNALPSTSPGNLRACFYVQSDTNLNASFAGDLKGSGGGLMLKGSSAGAGVVTAYGSWSLLTP